MARSLAPAALIVLGLCALVSAQMHHVPFVLPDLPYGYCDLDAYMNCATVFAHHTQHHQGYVDKLNAALSPTGPCSSLAGRTLDELQLAVGTAELNATCDAALRKFAGGTWNHNLFWQQLTIPETQFFENATTPAFKAAVEKAFGDYEGFKEEIDTAAGTVFGSGFAWLCVNSAQGDLALTTTANQQNPLMCGAVEQQCAPVMAIDLWEHAYYLYYGSDRAHYVEHFVDYVNWQQLSDNYEMAKEQFTGLDATRCNAAATKMG